MKAKTADKPILCHSEVRSDEESRFLWPTEEPGSLALRRDDNN
jgi:hypothetical protein